MVDFNNEGTVLKTFDDSDRVKMKLVNGDVYKIIETDKSSVAKSGIPFMEPLIMEYARRKGLPAPKVTNIVEQDGEYMFATEYVPYKSGAELLRENPDMLEYLTNYSDFLKQIYSHMGIDREMHLKDVAFEMKDGKIEEAIPFDFERIKYNDNLDWNTIYQICDEWGIELPERYQNQGNKTL